MDHYMRSLLLPENYSTSNKKVIIHKEVNNNRYMQVKGNLIPEQIISVFRLTSIPYRLMFEIS